MAILLKTTLVRVSSSQIIQVRVQNKGKSVWKSRYDGDASASGAASSTAAGSSSPPTHAVVPELPSRPLTRARADVHRLSLRYSSDEYLLAASTAELSLIPTSARAALHDPHWIAAMQEEFDALQRNRTWTLVPRPPRANVVRGKWVFRHKTDGERN